MKFQLTHTFHLHSLIPPDFLLTNDTVAAIPFCSFLFFFFLLAFLFSLLFSFFFLDMSIRAMHGSVNRTTLFYAY